jgi:membrane protein DedA with SNARE-associated domain
MVEVLAGAAALALVLAILIAAVWSSVGDGPTYGLGWLIDQIVELFAGTVRVLHGEPFRSTPPTSQSTRDV